MQRLRLKSCPVISDRGNFGSSPFQRQNFLRKERPETSMVQILSSCDGLNEATSQEALEKIRDEKFQNANSFPVGCHRRECHFSNSVFLLLSMLNGNLNELLPQRRRVHVRTVTTEFISDNSARIEREKTKSFAEGMDGDGSE
jgi:hypothetical protein